MPNGVNLDLNTTVRRVENQEVAKPPKGLNCLSKRVVGQSRQSVETIDLGLRVSPFYGLSNDLKILACTEQCNCSIRKNKRGPFVTMCKFNTFLGSYNCSPNLELSRKGGVERVEAKEPFFTPSVIERFPNGCF